MKERPILFSAPMVRAILSGTKTQTRRVVKPAPQADQILKPLVGSSGFRFVMDATPLDAKNIRRIRWDYSYGQPGDRLWVRESYQRFSDDGQIMYRADPESFKSMNELKRDDCLEARWRPSIHMPRWASRITLEVTGVRVERLQDISEADAIAEGVRQYSALERIQAGQDRWARHAYRSLWESIDGPGSWDANPWVWVVEFKRAEGATP